MAPSWLNMSHGAPWRPQLRPFLFQSGVQLPPDFTTTNIVKKTYLAGELRQDFDRANISWKLEGLHTDMSPEACSLQRGCAPDLQPTEAYSQKPKEAWHECCLPLMHDRAWPHASSVTLTRVSAHGAWKNK